MMDKQGSMIDFWSRRVREHGSDPESNTPDVWIRPVEIRAVKEMLNRLQPGRVLDFACANGYTTRKLAFDYPAISFVGIDINEEMIKAANAPPLPANLSFIHGDLFVDDIGSNYDLVICIRAIQNLESLGMQLSVFDRLHDTLAKDGHFFFIESYVDGYERINQDRVDFGLPPLPVQEHLTLLTGEFDEHVAKVMECVERGSPSSSYYLITRIVYTKLAVENNEKIDYNHPLHQLAAKAPPIGEYGPQKSGLFRKRRQGNKQQGS